MANERSTLVDESLLSDITQTAQALHESANKLTNLARQRNPDLYSAKWLIKITYFKLQFLAKRFNMEI